LVAYLTSVMTSGKAPARMRMAAAVRLDGIYARCEEQNERALARRERALNRTEVLPAEDVAPVLDEQDPETTALAFLELVRGKGRHDDDED